MKRARLTVAALFALALGLAAAADRYTYPGALKRVLENYPSLAVAQLALERARAENARVESQLSWTLAAQTGVARDVSLIFTPTDRADARAELNRRLAGGGRLGFDAQYSREESTQTFSPLIPNPATSTRVGVNYRHPLGQGADNPTYRQGLVNAQAQLELARADERALHDQVARQTAELFYAAADTAARLANVERAIGRAERLKRFILENQKLGLSESKDVLQVEAQHQARLAEQRGLLTAWIQQRTNLNRLMGRGLGAEVALSASEPLVDATVALERALADARLYNPELVRGRARLTAAEAAIALARDTQRDNVDLVFSLGNRSQSGDIPGASTSESEVVGGVRLEYQRVLDKRGVDAALRQALLDRDIALKQIETVEHDLRYDVGGLLSEIEAAHAALRVQRESLAAEEAKLADARRRYRQGRIDTDQLIAFEAELSAAELAAEQRALDLARRATELQLLRGEIWNVVNHRAPPTVPTADAARDTP